MHHLWWHRAMFHLERREFDEVLDLYDTALPRSGSPLTQAMPDLYIDVQNAASMLFRLERHGVDVGDRWSRARRQGRGAHRRLPVGLHPAALDDGAGGDRPRRGGQRMIEGMRAFGGGDGTVPRLIGARSRCRSARRCWRIARGDHADALDLMRPVLGDMYRLGGSHAQQDVLEQLFLDAP